MTILEQLLGDLASGRRLACTLKPHHHDGGHARAALDHELVVHGTHEVLKLVMADIDEVIRRAQTLR